MSDNQLEKIKITPYSEQPIPPIKSVYGWKETPILENNQVLVPLNSLNKELIVTQPQYYLQNIPHSNEIMHAREEVAEKLIEAAKLLPEGYKLLLWDTWRPLEVQQALFDKYYEKLKLENPEVDDDKLSELTQTYVSLPSDNPNKPSPHYTGGAVDLSILKTDGSPLPMGTEFDHFGPKAALRHYEELFNPSKQEIIYRNNRRILAGVMMEVGFSPYDEEWWHFDYGNQFDAARSDKENAVYGPIKIQSA